MAAVRHALITGSSRGIGRGIAHARVDAHGRLGTPEDVGNVVALFCSERAGWITGQLVYADGGASLMNPEVPTEIQIG